ncbi:hypothetical protein M0R89_09215 [Halorussus limi]|uniref:PRC-barrel domain-containing protein n=1 Tax=Halorussus limi TaxID=2938695 RepID=A0A8U0HPB7_9EURY|nr:hypothetical protein [Halorussus limi]UPV72727.1 hypothetical protein M0R89_09215 [Halorussus limi]
MAVQISESDVGKPVLDADGNRVGTVADVEDDIAYVDPDTTLTDRIKSKLDLEESRRKTGYPVSEARIASVSDDEIRLKRVTVTSGSSVASSDSVDDSSSWRQRLKEHTQFLRFLGTTLSLFKKSEDTDAFAEALSEGDIERALEQTDMTEEELAKRVENVEDEGKKALEDSEVRDAVLQYKEKDNDRHSD